MYIYWFIDIFLNQIVISLVVYPDKYFNFDTLLFWSLGLVRSLLCLKSQLGSISLIKNKVKRQYG